LSNFGARCEEVLREALPEARCVDLHGFDLEGPAGLWTIGREIRGVCVSVSRDAARIDEALSINAPCVVHWTGQSLELDRTDVPTVVARALLEGPDPVPIGPKLAKVVTDCIRAQNQEEQAGRMARGGLSVLRRQFTRPETYVFELLQNAADEGATHIRFQIDESNDSLVFEHNGSPFSVADVLGLSLIAHSGKQGRTIGFMGIGFKAVYKRFGRVDISDDVWRFGFERSGNDDRWKVLPRWCDGIAGPESGFSCRFVLRDADGGLRAIRQDLEGIPDEAAMLLGRRALKGNDGATTWTLELPERRVEIEAASSISKGIEQLRARSGETQRHWVYVMEDVEPSAAALEEYRHHREDEAAEPGRQEVGLFYSADPEGQPVPDQIGHFHAVLPTGAETTTRFSLQANWLLTSDRSQLCPPEDSSWNGELLATLADLFVSLLRWSSSKHGPPDPLKVFNLLPEPRWAWREPLAVKVLGHDVSLEPLEEAFRKHRLIPVRAESRRPRPREVRSQPIESARRGVEWIRADRARDALRFATTSNCVYVPPYIDDNLSPHFVRSWFGKAPIAAAGIEEEPTALLKALSDLQVWDDDLIDASSERLARLLGHGPRASTAMLWATLDFLDTVLDDVELEDPLEESTLVVPLATGRVGSRESARCLDARLFEMPRGLADAALDSLPEAEVERLLSVPLQRLLRNPPEWIGGAEDSIGGQHLIDQGLALVDGMRELPLKQLARRWFASLGDEPLARRSIELVVEWTRWAKRAKAPSLVPRVLVDDSSPRLVPRKKAALGLSFGGTDVQTVAGGKLEYVSTAYLDGRTGPDGWAGFFSSGTEPCITGITRNWRRLGLYHHSDSARFTAETGLSFPSLRVTKDWETSIGLTVWNTQVVLEGVDYSEPWRTLIDSASDLESGRREALARLLARSSRGNVFKRVRYIARGTSGLTDEWTRRDAPWIVRLRSSPWVPLVGGGTATPEEVLLDPDPTRPEAPVAQVGDAARAGLRRMPAQVAFGRAVPGGEPIDRLKAAIRQGRGSGILTDVWNALLNDDRYPKLKKSRLEHLTLRAAVGNHPCIPVRSTTAPGSSIELVTTSRLIRGRNTLGGWLYSKPGVEVREPDRLFELFRVPVHPRPEQAIDALLACSEQRSHDGPVFHKALRFLLDEAGETDSPWRVRLRKLVAAQRLRLPCRGQPGTAYEWLGSRASGPTPVLPDDPVLERFLQPDDGYCFVALPSREFGYGELRVLGEMLGWAKLSDPAFAMTIEGTVQHPLDADDVARFAQVLVLLSDDWLAQEVPNISRAIHLSRLCEMPNGCDREVPTPAAWDPELGVLVVGEPLDYFHALKVEVRCRLGLMDSRSADEVCDLLVHLEDGPRFESGLRRLVEQRGLAMDPLITVSAKVHQSRAEVAGTSDESRSVQRSSTLDAETSESDEHNQQAPGSQGPSGRRGAPREITPASVDGASQGTATSAETAASGRSTSATGQNSTAGSGQPSSRPRGSAAGRDYFTAGLAPRKEARGTQSTGSPRTDEDSRAVVVRYERLCGREPRVAPPHQEGFDLDSVDPASGTTRRIEVKGLDTEWSSKATVTVKRRQFQEASLHSGTDGVEFWLYIVDRKSTAPRLRAFRNFAWRVEEVYVAARDWDALADETWEAPPEG